MDLVKWMRNQWDRFLAWVLVAIGALVLVLGWVGVTSTPYTFEQIPYVISGGLGGIFLLGMGAMLWISADLRDEWRILNELLETKHDSQPTMGIPVGGVRSTELAPAPGDAAMMAAGSRPQRSGSAGLGSAGHRGR